MSAMTTTEAATKIQAVFRGAVSRKWTKWEQLTPNDYLDNIPPDSLEGLTFDEYGYVKGHSNWGCWTRELNRWVMVCSQDLDYWYWDATNRVWVRDTTSAFFEHFEGKW